MKYNRLAVYLLGIFIFAGFLAGCDDENTSEPVPITELNPPSDVRIVLTSISGTSAQVRWTGSTNEGADDFNGYDVVTREVDTAGNLGTQVDSTFLAKDLSKFHTVPLASSRDIRYQTYVYAVRDDGRRSEPAKSIVYGGIWESSNSKIDEFSQAAAANSGFGWDPFTGLATRYAYTAGNANNIDLHLRTEGGVLSFFSPQAKTPGTRRTFMAQLGTGQTAYDRTEGLVEPNLTNIGVTVDNVYLLRTQDSIYVKVWVRSIAREGTNTFSTVTFDSKLQPIEGLRVLKSR